MKKRKPITQVKQVAGAKYKRIPVNRSIEPDSGIIITLEINLAIHIGNHGNDFSGLVKRGVKRIDIQCHV